MTAKIIVVINVVIKNFFPIFGFFGAPGSTPPILSLKTSLFDRIPIGSTEKNRTNCKRRTKFYRGSRNVDAYYSIFRNLERERKI